MSDPECRDDGAKAAMPEERLRDMESFFAKYTSTTARRGQELCAEVRRRGKRIRELELCIAGEAWQGAMRGGTPEQVEKLTAFIIEREDS